LKSGRSSVGLRYSPRKKAQSIDRLDHY
jgi:hypothetical protein